MKQSLMLMTIVLSMCGCAAPAQRPAQDPFVGRTRVNPPGTGSVSDRAADPYYRGVPRSAVAPLRPLAAVSESPRKQASTASLDHSRRVIRVIEPRGGQKDSSRMADASNSREPRLLDPSERIIDISQLPEARKRNSSTSSSSGFKLVSATEDVPERTFGPVDDTITESPTEREAVTARPVNLPDIPSRSGYGFGQDYKWLRGKLEYSQIDRRWKLRYIPADGTTDKYGGSVILSDTAALSGLERGDFVEAKGNVADDAKKGSYAPTYEVADIRRIGVGD